MRSSSPQAQNTTCPKTTPFEWSLEWSLYTDLTVCFIKGRKYLASNIQTEDIWKTFFHGVSL